MSVGENIRDLRKKRGLTQEELANIADISVFTLRQYESGARTSPHIEQLEKLSKALGVSVDRLIIDPQKIAERAEQLRTKEEAMKNISNGVFAAGGSSVHVNIPDMYLRDSIEEAEAELLSTVHDICGMDDDTITEDTASGAIYQKWNPQKIKIVKEYLSDGKSQIRKLISAELPPEQENDDKK